MHVVANVPFIPKEVVVLLSSRLRSSIPTRLNELGDVIKFIGLRYGRVNSQQINMLKIARAESIHGANVHACLVGARFDSYMIRL